MRLLILMAPGMVREVAVGMSSRMYPCCPTQLQLSLQTSLSPLVFASLESGSKSRCE